MVKVIIADDEEFVRYFLKSIMESLNCDIVAEVEKGDELIYEMEKYNPDILLLDINMPNLTGIEFLEQYALQFPNTCFIILTAAKPTMQMADKMLQKVHCFLKKDTPMEQMISKIKTTWSDFKNAKK